MGFAILFNFGVSDFSLMTLSHLLPKRTNGKVSGHLGLSWLRNSVLQVSIAPKDFGSVKSQTNAQHSEFL